MSGNNDQKPVPQQEENKINELNAPGLNTGESVRKAANFTGEQVKASLMRKAANWIRNKLGKESIKSAAKLSLSGPLGLLLLKVFIALIIVILLIGIVMFIVTMPGMIMDKLKNLAESAADAFLSWWGESTADQVDDEKIYETLDYIEDMGYDLKGHGFLTDYVGTEEQIINYVKRNFGKYWSAARILGTEDPVSYDHNVGVVRNEDGNIKYAASDFILAYLASENYIYTIKNFNLDNLTPIEALINHIGSVFTDSLNGRTGMLVLKHEGSKIGSVAMGPVNEKVYDKGELGSIEIDPEAKTLIIKRGWFNPKMKFSLDGWTGRYGMPLDFLVAIQTATSMPDLAYDMTQAFDTEVHILLHKANNGSLNASYQTDDGRYVTYDQMSMAINGTTDETLIGQLVSEIDQWGLNKNEAQELIDLGIVPPDHNPPDCGCKVGYRCDDVEYYNAYIQKRMNDNGTPEDNSDDFEEYYYIEPLDPPVEETQEDGSVKMKYSQEVVIASPESVYESITKIGENCKKYFKAVVNYADKNNYDSFDTYTPYIEKVKNHWFRDVYFVRNSRNEVDFVDMDYEYEALMKERWTLYEKYSADPADEGKYNYNPDKAGQEILFVMNEDGTYKKENGEYVVFDGTVEDANPSVLYYEKDGNYEEYTDGLATAKEKGIKLYRKSSTDEYVEYTGNVAVSKKAQTIDITEEYKDLGWNNMGSGSYSAYSPKESEFSEWQAVYIPGVEKYDNEKSSIVRAAMEKLFVEVKYGVVSQTGEGQRTETNPEIKKMFLNNNYFRYDGSAETAEIITELRYAVYNERYGIAYADAPKDEYGNPIVKVTAEKYGPLTEEELEKEYEITYGTLNKEKTEVHKVGDYAGKLEVLTQDALNAFAMLENTHTLDADYIYRDFKELIVELGYFEKEQLTDENPRLLQFPIPSIGSAEYPARSIDKRVNVDGTMLHSKYDIETNKKYINLEIEKSMVGDLGNEENSNSQVTETETEQVNNTESSATGIAESEITRVANGRVSMSSNTIANTTEVGSISKKSSARRVSLKEFLETTREMCEQINEVGFDYCVSKKIGEGDYRQNDCSCTDECKADFSKHYGSGTDGKWICICGDSCGVNHCKHTIHGNSCGLPNTFEIAIQSGPRNLCCDRLVKWALQNVGLIEPDGGVGGAENLGDYIHEELGATLYSISETEIQPGDIVYGPTHIEIVGEKKDGGFVQYNGGHQVPAGVSEGESGSSIGFITGPFSGAEWILRLPWGTSEDAMYEGYEGNEAVVSPVTGMLLEYGVFDSEKELKRENIDLKYGPSISIHLDEEGNVESVETNEQSNAENVQDTENTENQATEDDEYEPVFEEVGYAVIRVMSKDDFEALESGIENHYWSDYNGKKGLLDHESGVFEEAINNEDELKNILDSMPDEEAFLAETIYGYKEFAELYSTYGIYIDSEQKTDEEDDNNNTEEVRKLISGYTIYIDGFKCELPDENFIDTNDDGSVADETTLPDGEDLTIDSFKIAPEDISKQNKLIQTQYEMAEEYKLASKKATEKLNIEEVIKADAYPVMEVNDVIYIKEGTVIGRTFTDKEVVEVLRKDKNEKVEDYKISSTMTDEELNAEDYEFNDRLIGNYLRIKMYETDSQAPIEDVEAYMKLDTAVPKAEVDWEFYYWLPYESGPIGEQEPGNYHGAGACGTVSGADEVAVGFAQWTTLKGSSTNNIPGLCKWLAETEPGLCGSLATFSSYSADKICSELKSLQTAWYSVYDTNPERFLELQMQYFYDVEYTGWLEKAGVEWMLEKSLVAQGTYASLKNWGPNLGWEDVIDSSMSDEEIVKALLTKARPINSTCGTLEKRWDSQYVLAKDILSGAFTDVEDWVKTKKPDKYENGKNPGALLAWLYNDIVLYADVRKDVLGGTNEE